MRPSRPAFQSVIDLGLRDVGVENRPRRLAAHFGKSSIPVVALVIVFAVAICAVARQLGADAWIIVAVGVAWPAILFAVALRMVNRSPIVVVKVDERANQATWMVLGPAVLLLVAAALLRDPLVLPVVVLTAIMAVIVWRARGRVPVLLRRVRPLLGAGEPVLGDGIALARGARGREALRLIVATERRILIAGFADLVDVRYEYVSRFGIAWKALGRMGELSLTVAGQEHVLTSIAPANLVSIAQALHSHGVQADDPAAVREAQRGWDDARRRNDESRDRVLDRAAMSSREFDRGLWLFLGLSAALLYLNPFGIGLVASPDGLPVLAGVAIVSAVCGYVSGTRSSLLYVAPLNLLLLPAFFFADAGDVILVMLVMSALATLGLRAGSALGTARRPATASPAARAPRGSLRHTLSGRGLVLLATMAALAATAAAAGFELTSVRLAVDEVIGDQVPVDGRSDLTGNAASLTYTPGPDLHEFITDEDWGEGPNDGARWELRSSFTKGYNVLSLSHYIFVPRLDEPAAVAKFIADKDREHARLAGYAVSHTERVVDGRKAYVWNHGSRRGYWFFTAWFPQPVHSVRVECMAKRQTPRFRRLCSEAMGSLEFH